MRFLQGLMSGSRKIHVAGATDWFLEKKLKKKLRKKIYVADSTAEYFYFPSKTLHWDPRNGF